MIRRELMDLPQVRVMGRIHRRTQPQPLFWAASGLDFCFTGSQLWLEVDVDYAQIGPWLSVEVNGAWISRIPLRRGRQRICLAREMTKGVSKRIRVFKDTQPMYDDPRNLVCAVALAYSDGEILSPPLSPMRIEFVGDSITSGEGTMGAALESDWSGLFFGAMPAYCRLTADRLRAEFRTISQGGWGIRCGWDNNPLHRIDRIYLTVCAAASGSAARKLGAGEPNNFEAWRADAVVVNLGTNDHTSFFQSPWTNPETGQQYQSHLGPGGDYSPEDASQIQQAVCQFLHILRQCNPQAHIVWCYGMLPGNMDRILQQSIDSFCATQKDSRCHFLRLPPNSADTMGSMEHPGPLCHQKAADVLSMYLSSILSTTTAPYEK